MMTLSSSKFCACAIFLLGILIIESVDGGRSKRMVTGITSTPEQYKYVVGIIYRRPGLSWSLLLGGGAIVSNRFVLTSAQRVGYLRISNIHVALGIGSSTAPEGVEQNIEHVIKHPDYQPEGEKFAENDIALLLLTEAITSQLFDGSLTQIYLPYYQVKKTESCTFGSFSKRRETSVMPLSTMEQVLVDLDKCGLNNSTGEAADFRHLCAHHGFMNTDESMMGNALVHDGYIVGVASYRKNFNDGSILYTNVYAYNEWILSEILKIFTDTTAEESQVALEESNRPGRSVAQSI